MKTSFCSRMLCLMAGILMTMGLAAAPITREQAKKNALEYLKRTKGSRVLAPVSSRQKLAPRRAKTAQADTELYYVFNRGDQQGYVIVSGDDRTQPIIGYTEEGEFDYNQLPDNMRHWLDCREQELLDLSTQIGTQPMYALPTHDAISPMVTTKWNQGSPYNDECPMYFTLGRSVTGCVATAMAQVLYFQRAKSVTEVQAAIPGYTGWTSHATYGNLTVEGIEEGSPIDWDNMLDTYGSATAKQKQAVAQLMHYCGVAVHMDYTNSSSGAQSSEVPTAFQKYFGYGSQTRIVYQTSYSDEAWDVMLYNELAQGRPFYLSGYNSSGGHAFVCDGYDGNTCYHINWGWGGASDGYYMLSKLNPGSQGIGGSSGGYSEGEAAVIGCEPENYGEKAMPIANATVKKVCLANFDANGDGVFTFGEAAAVTDLGEAFKGQTAITAFTELYNFTGLTALADDAFNGCTKLASVKLPKNLKRIGRHAFAGCRALKTFTLPDGLTSIGDSAFAGCRVLPNLALPSGVKRIEDQTFEGCLAFTAMELPIGISYIGKEAFKGCTKLQTVTVKSINPQDIVLGNDVFSGIDLSTATLNTLQGTRQYFAQADQWKEFGNLYEERTLAQGNYATLATNTKYYLYNVGTGYYMTKGEAWGTQAIVGETDEPMRFEFRHTASMPDGVYYLYSDDTGNSSRHYFFRTTTDPSVGSGIPACFVDGQSSNLTAAAAYWRVALAEGYDNVYTLQIPSTVSTYKATQYLGIQPDHASNAASPTYGAYSDVEYADYTQNCQWMLVAYDESKANSYLSAKELKNLLALAKTKHVESSLEQAVYDDFASTDEDIAKACRKLRRKMSFINFVDKAVRTVAISRYDVDNNGELSYSEAAAVETIDTPFSGNTSITDLSDLQYFTGAEYLTGTAFQGCTKLTTATLPDQMTGIFYHAFRNCSQLQRISIGSHITSIGDLAFGNCTRLTEVRIAVPDPASISLGSNVFQGVKVAQATLYVPEGSKALYANAPVWKTFGNIVEMRSLRSPGYAPVEENTDYYIYNLGLRENISKGEAYGTQAVTALNGMVYQLRRTNSMPERTYYLYSEETGNSSSRILFRTASDSKVGTGVKACFVDGSVSAKAYWKLAPVEGMENVFTLQVPANDADYVEGEYLGTDTGHASDATYGTHGLYYDISYASNPSGCQWAAIGVEALKAEQAFYDLTLQLKELLDIADAREIEATREHAVYDDFASTQEQIETAIATLRSKLHYIEFLDNRARTICVNTWDDDEDGELSLEEAAAVTDLGQLFRTSTSLKSFDEFRYFTSVTSLDEEAFRGCTSLVSIYLPASLTTLGSKTFYNDNALKYIAIMGEKGVVEGAADASLPRGLTAFVPKAKLAAYEADETWGAFSVKEYTGTPTVTAVAASRQYGRSNPKFTFDVTGAPVNGEPELSSEAEMTSPIGEYAILTVAGTITTPGLVCAPGVLTVERAPLTLTATSFTRNIGEANPELTFSNTTLRNREKIDDILTVRPTLECDATADSPAGIYEIRISGAEADNYEITHVNGTLTVVDPTGIGAVKGDEANSGTTPYDLTGRKVTTSPAKGIYIINRRKQVVR